MMFDNPTVDVSITLLAFSYLFLKTSSAAFMKSMKQQQSMPRRSEHNGAKQTVSNGFNHLIVKLFLILQIVQLEAF